MSLEKLKLWPQTPCPFITDLPLNRLAILTTLTALYDILSLFANKSMNQ